MTEEYIEESYSETESEKEKEEQRKEQRKAEQKIERRERSVKAYQRFFIKIIIFIFVIWLLFFYFIGIAVCPTNDMHPRIDYGDLVLYYRLEDHIKTRDVVVIEKTLEDKLTPDTFVLRVVAQGGDTVEVTESGRLVVNGNGVSEPDIYYDTVLYEGFRDYPVTLAEDEYFVLADRRDSGNDSRNFGPVKKDEIIGTAIAIMRRHAL